MDLEKTYHKVNRKELGRRFDLLLLLCTVESVDDVENVFFFFVMEAVAV